jgi:hypothetical protein
VADAARDVAKPAGALGLGRFSVLGHSGGAPHPLSCAALLPPARDRSWFDGMAASTMEEFSRALAFAGRLAADIRRDHAQLLVSLRGGLTDSDRRIVSEPAVGEMLLRTYREALRASPYGRLDDDLVLLGDWTGSAHHRTGPRHDHDEPPYGRCVRGSTGCPLRCVPLRARRR